MHHTQTHKWQPQQHHHQQTLTHMYCMYTVQRIWTFTSALILTPTPSSRSVHIYMCCLSACLFFSLKLHFGSSEIGNRNTYAPYRQCACILDASINLMFQNIYSCQIIPPKKDWIFFFKKMLQIQRLNRAHNLAFATMRIRVRLWMITWCALLF